MNFILIAIVGIIYAVLLIKRPHIIATLLIFALIYGFNHSTPLFFDLRGLLIITLLFRFVIDRDNQKLLASHFLSNIFAVLLVIFTFFSIALTIYYYGDIVNSIRTAVVLIGCLILGYLVSSNSIGKNSFIAGIFISGLASTIDLVYSYITYSSYAPTKVLNYLLYGEIDFTNHNYFGLLTGMSLVFGILFYLKNKKQRVLGIIIIIYSGLGLLLSTSRGSILGVLIIFAIMMFVQKEMKITFKKALSFWISIMVLFASFYFLYNLVLKSTDGDSTMMDNIYYRLYEEPMNVLGLMEKTESVTDAKIQYGNMDWRYNNAVKSINKYLQANIFEQMMGIGIEGYLFTNYNNEGAALHNGYILLLIERGLIGSGIFLFILIGSCYVSLKNARKYDFDISISYVLIFLMIFAVSHNAEITSPKGYIILGGTIGNLYFVSRTHFKNQVKLKLLFMQFKEKFLMQTKTSN